jgi:predicted nucleic acid-binding Zn ribbon protein
VSLDPIADMLAPFLERIGLAKPDTAARISSEWSDLAGEPWASQARPAGLREGQLVVDVVDAATVSLLRYRTGELLKRMDEELGEGTVEVVRLRVAKQPF